VEAWFGNYQKYKRKTTAPHRLHAGGRQVWQLYKFDLIDNERSHLLQEGEWHVIASYFVPAARRFKNAGLP